MKELYNRIKQRREDVGYTQKYMSDELDIDPATYSRIESGKIDITISRLESIAALLKTDINSLLAYNAIIPIDQALHNPKVTLQIELEDSIKADVITLAFGKRVLEIKNK